MLLRTRNLTFSCGSRFLLKGITFSLDAHEKVGLVGPAGSGKTTLLRLLAGDLEPDDGEVFVAPDVEVGYLRQLLPAESRLTVSEKLFGKANELQRRLTNLSRTLDRHPEDDGARAKYETLKEELSSQFGSSYRERLEETLLSLGVDRSKYRSQVSGLQPREQAALEIAQLLVRKSDLLILDEPTTHLDMVQRKSLGHLLAAFPGSILLVDRDRALLDSVVNRVFELRDARLRTIEGDYQDYERQLRLSMREQQHKIYQTSRIQRKETHSRTEHTAVRHADRHLSSNSTDTAERKQVPVVQVSRLTKSFARRPLLDNVTFSVHLGERVALLGPAGSGKTVLLRIIAGEISPDKGNIKLAAGLRLGYVPQVVTKTPETGLSEDNTDSNSSTTVSPATPLSDVQQLTQECDILLLDNPTQLLDIDSIIALEELLLQFPGTLLFATHDRALARKLATRLLVFNKGIIDDRSSIANHSLISS